MNKQSKVLGNFHAKPFLKWAGGKKRLLPRLLKSVPKEYNNYYEPFLGGGTLFFALCPEKAFLSDANEELIITYQQIKKNVANVIRLLKNMKYSKKAYYRIRKEISVTKATRAARFIYLNRTCWNGLYRVNPKGEFNVPIGRYTNPTICDSGNLKTVSKLLKNASLKVDDFETTVANASVDDLIYFDPPYVTAHNNNSFVKYTARIFSMEDQERLRNLAIGLHKRGCKIIISNAAHKSIITLYKHRIFKIQNIKRKSLIAGLPQHRKTVKEVIITNFTC